MDRVKRSESGMIVDPITIEPELKIFDALALMKRYRISGVPVTKNGTPGRNPDQSRFAIRNAPRSSHLAM